MKRSSRWPLNEWPMTHKAGGQDGFYLPGLSLFVSQLPYPGHALLPVVPDSHLGRLRLMERVPGSLAAVGATRFRPGLLLPVSKQGATFLKEAEASAVPQIALNATGDAKPWQGQPMPRVSRELGR